MKNYLTLILIAVLLNACTEKQPESTNETADKYSFRHGYPAIEEIPKIYDELDYQRAVQTYLWATPIVAVYSFIEGMKRDFNADMYTSNIWEKSASPTTVVLTGNSQSIYSVGYFDLSETGPFVLEFPENLLGMIDNLWYAPVTDVGLAGPDRGKGGKYLILPPNYTGAVPDGYYTFESSTFLNIWLVRGFKGKDGSSPVDKLKQVKLYPLDKINEQPEMTYNLVSNLPAELTFPLDERFFNSLAQIFAKENVREKDLAYLGMMHSLGIGKGKVFNPDERVKSIFKKAAETGNAMARAIAYSSRNESKRPYPNSQWEWIFLTDKPNFYTDNYLDIEARITYTHQACFTANGMVLKNVGVGSQYFACYKSSEGNWLDGAKNYKLTLPANIPVVNFWSLMAYSSDTRSMVVTDTKKAGLDSYGEVKKNTDGSIDLYLGPTPPAGLESNWIKTEEQTGFFVYLRFFGPKQEFFDKSWIPGEIELVEK
jgi:hypothetical protein